MRLFASLRNCICLVLFFPFCSCENSGKEKVTQLVKEWMGKEILFPANSVFTIQGKDTVDFAMSSSSYKVVTYIDSIGCTSCKLQLARWKTLMSEVDSLTNTSVSFVFYLCHKNKKELCYFTRREVFTYPVCFDIDDEFNKLNHFPSDTRFQTFLLDENNKVVAIGNPIHNPKIKELYFDIIQGKKSVGKELTTVKLNKTSIDLSTFDWRKEKLADVELVNTGSQPLIIDDVVTSCSCTTVEFPRESFASGQSVKLKIKYNAEKPEPFYRTMSIYCNTKDSPLEIEITGEGK